MAMNGTDMAGAIVGALAGAGKLAGLDDTQKAALKADMAIAYTAMVDYIVANIEIKGVKVSDPAITVETYLAGVGSNTGDLNAPPYPVVGNIKKAAQTLDQIGPSTGLVS